MSTITQLNLKEDNLDQHLVITRDEARMIIGLVSSITKQLEVLNEVIEATGLGSYGNQHPRKISNLDIPVIVKD
jgi:hypothetical protein